MKKLQESLLDDEDKLLNDTKKPIEISKNLKILDSYNQAWGYWQDGVDAIGRDLEKGDLVLYYDKIEQTIRFYIIAELNMECNMCLLCDNKNSYNKALGTYVKMNNVLKISSDKIAKELMK